jgi:hypothetical protein
MDNKVLPVELVRRTLGLVQNTHKTVSAGILPGMIATKRNAVAMAMLPEASVILQAAISTFRIRVGLWIVAAIAVVISPILTWWFLVGTVLAVIAERFFANKEREFWILLAGMLLAAEMLACDFAGWGTAHPDARDAAIAAIAPESGGAVAFQWLDYYLPRRDQLDPEVMRAFGPIV